MLAEEEGGGSGPYAPGFLRPGRERHREREKEEGKKVVEGGGGGKGGVPAYISREAKPRRMTGNDRAGNS